MNPPFDDETGDRHTTGEKDLALTDRFSPAPSKDWREKLARWRETNSPTISPAHAFLRTQFVTAFPARSLDSLTKEQYGFGYQAGNFCWWLDIGTKDLGYVKGGPKKWGVWFDRDAQGWRSTGTAGTPDAEFARIRNGLVDAVDVVSGGSYDKLDDDALNFVGTGHGGLRIKPLSLYFPDEFLPLTSWGELGLFLEAFGQEPAGSLLARNRQLLRHLRGLPEFAGFDTDGMMRFLTAAFITPDGIPETPEVAAPTEDTPDVPAPQAVPAPQPGSAETEERPAPAPILPVVRELLGLVGRTRNIVLYGAPGTGKTFYAHEFAKKFLGKAFSELVFVAFHPSYTYDDFVESPRISETSGDAATAPGRARTKPGVFRDLCARAEAFPRRAFLLVIDDIHRADASRVFGELLTLIEDDKRTGETNALTAMLPFSGKAFGVPRNLFIVATMTEGAAPMDAALRRRFTFVQTMPEPDVLTGVVEGVPLSALLSRLNRRIAASVANGVPVGHAYLLPVQTLADLRHVWYRKIVPLLADTFGSDTETLRGVLGTAFFDAEETDEALFDAQTAPPPRPRYRLKPFTGDDAGFVAALARLAGI